MVIGIIYFRSLPEQQLILGIKLASEFFIIILSRVFVIFNFWLSYYDEEFCVAVIRVSHYTENWIDTVVVFLMNNLLVHNFT